MSNLTPQQRKMAYLVGIVILLIPIIWLGMPASGADGSGGLLAKLRQPPPVGYDLGETTLGKVDPSSATMNLVLLGLRGVATNLLWMEALESKEHKDWGKLRTTIESIILLQPHFLAVWRHQSWNLAYNVSAEWDGVGDRYYWVKEGAKFSMQGTERNKRFAPLFFDTANILGPKIGRADEWRQFRKFFNPSAYPGDDAAGDPDRQKWEGGPDQDINPDRKDNYVVAGDWSVQANAVEERYGQTGLMRLLFRQSPSKYLLDYAEARQREGSFDEITQFAWEEAFRAWTEDFGRERFAVYDPYQKRSVDIQLEATEEDIASMAADQGVKADFVRKWTANMQNICNYRYWRTRALAEKEQETVSAHREIYDGQQLFKSAQTEEALKLLDSGMTRFQEMLNRHPQLSQEDSTIEEALMSILYWQASHVLLERQPPADFPLKALWEKEQGRLPQIQKQFRTETSIN